MQNQLTQTKSANTLIVSNSTRDELKTVLAYIYTLCGFEKMPDETQDMVLIGFIREHFSNLSLTDIKTAFELGVSGETGVTMKHYHNFNSIYFSDVINAYKTYKRNKKGMPLLIEAKKTPKEEKDTTTFWLNDHVYPRIEKFFKTGEYDLPDYGNTLYNYLDKKFINLTPDRKKEIKEQARIELLNEFRMEKRSKPHERHRIGKVITDIITEGQDTEGLVRTRAKKIVLKIFIQNCKATNRDLIAEIKEYEQ